MKVFDDKDLVLAAISSSGSISQVLVILGLPKTGPMYKSLRKWAAENGVELPQHKRKFPSRIDLSDILVENSTYTSNQNIKTRLISELGWEYKCSEPLCENPNPSWAGKPLTIQLDHINGINNDNRIENLRFLCPNCHSQTETYGSKNTAKKSMDLLCSCGRRKSRVSVHCALCENNLKLDRDHKITWPDLDILVQMLRSSNYSRVSMELGVSGNAIRKHITKRGINYKTLESL